jgi:translation initiation factor 1
VGTRRPPPASPPGALGTRLADALAARGIAVSAPAAAPAAATPAAGALSRAGKVVLRRERKGRGGKTATVVAGLGLPARDLERVARELKRGLGCGATVEGDTIVLQGDQVPRAGPWLVARGVGRIVVGS